MQHKGREKAAKVVEFVAKWLNLCPSTVYTICIDRVPILTARGRKAADLIFPFEEVSIVSKGVALHSATFVEAEFQFQIESLGVT